MVKKFLAVAISLMIIVIAPPFLRNNPPLKLTGN